MDSSQLLTPHYDPKDGISSGGSWNLSLLDDNALRELTAFELGDGMQNSIDCLSLQLSTSSLADVQDFLVATDSLFLNDGPSASASNTQASASNVAVDRSFNEDSIALHHTQIGKEIGSLKSIAAQVATARDAECGYRSAAHSRRANDSHETKSALPRQKGFSLSMPETVCYFQEISRLNLVPRREKQGPATGATFAAQLTRPTIHCENFEYMATAAADWGALGRSAKTSGWLLHRDSSLGLDVACTFDLPGAATALEWCSASTIASACGDVISMITFDENGANPITVSVPAFHKGTIRDLAAVSPTGLVLTCGNDGCCFIFDATRLKSEMAGAAETCYISCLSVGHPLSSVGWRTDSTVSVTTDSGLCALFDVRGSSDLTQILGHTQYTGAASHTWLDCSTVALGMRDGGIQIYDLRWPDRMLMSVADATCTAISDIEHLSGCLAVVGEPGFSLWQYNGSGLALKASFEQPLSAEHGRLGSCFSGTLLPMKGADAVNVLCCSGEGVLKDIQVTF